MALSSRQPFGEIGSSRLQALGSAKNRQNAIMSDFSSPLKQSMMDFSSPLKQVHSANRKRRAPSVFEDDDAENTDPSTFNSPTKKSKTTDSITKPSHFSLLTSPSKPSPLSASNCPPVPSVRKPLSSPKPHTTNSTPISHSRGSPKHKRVGLLSKRRASSSPFRRVDPPSFSHGSPGLPFSIDAALKGSIPDYTPKATIAAPAPVLEHDQCMPKSWFFEIHEDTPEQEAANLMEHSASVLDISSDDDSETKRRNEDLERGKENVPPPDFVPMQAGARSLVNGVEMNESAPVEHVKRPRLRKIAQDAMDEDRKPLGDLPAAEFYGEGLDATSYVTVDAGLDKPSGLSKEFDFNSPVPTPEEAPSKPEVDEPAVEPVVEETPIQIFVDSEPQCESSVALQEDVSTSTVDAPTAQEVSCSAIP